MITFKEIEKKYKLGGGTNKREQWPIEAQRNKNIIAGFDSEIYNCVMFLNPANDNYNTFITTLDLGKTKNVDVDEFTYNEIISVPENPYDKQFNIKIWTDLAVKVYHKDYELILVPYNNGVMIHSIKVNPNKRGKRIGTKLMNKLYDCSEKLDIPLFLTPYPDEIIEKDTLWDRIHKLRNWYSTIGFGGIFGSDWIWSNYYENDLIK